MDRYTVVRRGVDFLHGVISDDKELSKWKEFAAGIPRFLRTGKKKENGLINGKTVIYSMNDLSRQVLRDICDAFEENRTGIMRLALEAMKVLPPEKLAKKEEKKIHSTVRLREEEYGRLEALKARLNYNGNGIFRTGLFLANRELKERRMNRQSEPKCISINSDLWRSGSFIPVDNVQQSVILRP